MADDTQQISFLGTSLSDLYNGQGPWCFSTPSLAPSKYHQVLFEVPATLLQPPKAHVNSEKKHWDDDHVRMPYSLQSSFLVNKNGTESIRPRWEVINEALSQPIKTVEELQAAIEKYNNKLPKFTALQHLFTDVFEEEETTHFFNQLLPDIITLALSLPDLVPGNIPLLKKAHCKSLSVSQLQVASLMANAFLCTFLWRKEAVTYRSANFLKLFIADKRPNRRDCVTEKLKCLLHYFRRVTRKHPVGVLTFERKHIPKSLMPRWDTVDNNLGNTKIHITSQGTIEDAAGMLQVDFANRFIGGGVLGYGCVQEEIRFVICPELIISRLFTEELENNESLVIYGAERFSDYSGYSDEFKWTGDHNDVTPHDVHGRRRTTITAIDATRFNRTRDQYHPSVILRELNKAYVGFQSRETRMLAPVATGNWGCGAFKGEPNLKTLIQLMACNAATRNLVYFSFGNVELRDAFYRMHAFLAANRVTVAQLWRYLCRFCAANLTSDRLYSFVQQCHFDSRSQPTLKQFIAVSQKRKIEVTPPTSQQEIGDGIDSTGLDSPAPSTSSTLDITNSTSKVEDINPSTSSEQKPGPVKEKSSDLDIANSVSNVQHTASFSSSQSKPTVKEKSSVKGKSSRRKTVNGDEVVDEDIREILDLIDGKPDVKSKPEERNNFSFLSELETTRKELENPEVRIDIPMDVDTEPVEVIKEKKHKITDYFMKM